MVNERTVRDTALPGARVSTSAPIAAFGGGQALENSTNAARELNNQSRGFAVDAANERLKVIAQQKKYADDLRIQEADLELSKFQTDLQIKVKGMGGKDALQAPEIVSSSWKKNADAIRASLANDEQRMQFDKINAVRYADTYKNTNEHVFTQIKKYDDESTDAYIVNAQNNAANNYMDTAEDGQISQAIFQQEQALRRYAERNGIPDEVLEKKIFDARSKTHTAVIDQMLSNDADQLAMEYFKNNKENIDPEKRVKIEESIDKAMLTGEGQRKADEIFVKFKDNRNAAFLNVDNTIKDPKLKKSVEDQLERMFTRQSLNLRAQNQQDFQIASQLVEQNKPVPANLSGRLTAAQNSALDRRLKQVNAQVEPQTDWATYYDLKMMAANNPNGFVSENLIQYRHQLSNSEFKDLTNIQSQISKNPGSSNATLGGFRTTTQVINDTLTSAGFNVKSKNANDVKRIADFRRAVDERLQILQEQTGKKPRADEVQKVTDSLLIDVITKRGGFMGLFDSKKKAFELQYKDIPVSDRDMIIKEMKKRGKVPTERSILEYYRIGKTRDGR